MGGHGFTVKPFQFARGDIVELGQQKRVYAMPSLDLEPRILDRALGDLYPR